ncbi:PREDICTED: pentatricopeptide repeat-containing protein At2g20710, mitochondrial-like isoform X1 [Nicotiana attenuata]|uniref:Pentatricopeptide repeat-containing protein, mitochondrial n=1 Tax=Nicotiana attenuata TaxID=49451 RepID=A0A1J6I408_NICAT|nr:PREDICTED: pentatricopeptide repeat-containing protein At2g20710, mitochondrial-like isoform X1 [Nicotiana attenuata]OIS99235.1 pentatricopeptide repeat-containing protein, mitochondrial [Nicotiana attenuata]
MKLFISIIRNSSNSSAHRNVLNRFYVPTSSKHLYRSPNGDSLYRRISPLGDPNESIVPVLDQWINEGKHVVKEDLQNMIKELRGYRRYKHALEVSYWMTDKRFFSPQPADIAARIHLLFKVKGLEEVEKYLNSIPQQLKGFHVYSALLNCYTSEKCVQKAEEIMQKVRDMGLARTPLCYNFMMKMYYQTGSWEKIDNMMNEMEGKGIIFDQFTLMIRLSAYAVAGDSDGIDKIVTMMESDQRITLDWNTYSIASEMYLKVGQVEKALGMLTKLEGMLAPVKKNNVAFDLLLRQYAKAGKKQEVRRVWDLYKQNQPIYNKGYISMMSSLMKFDDIEGAEQIFEEWESRGLSYDFRVPNILIGAYCRNGLLQKAKALIDRGSSKGGVPSVATWCHLASGYIHEDQVSKAVEALSKAVSICPPKFKPSRETLRTCVEYWENGGNVEKAEEFVRSLEVEGVFSAVFCDKLRCFINKGKL